MVNSKIVNAMMKKQYLIPATQVQTITFGQLMNVSFGGNVYIPTGDDLGGNPDSPIYIN